MTKAKKVTVDDVKEYFIEHDSTTYRAVYLDTAKQFLEIIERGKINLYEVYRSLSTPGANGMMYNSSSVALYVAKGTDTVKELKYTNSVFSNKKRKEAIANLIMDNKTVYDTFIADDELGFDEVRNLVHLYNTGVPFVKKDSKPKKIRKDKSANLNANQE